MSRTVYKYHIEAVGDADLHVGGNPVVRHVGLQYGRMMAWVEVDEGPPTTVLPLYVAGTGWPIPAVRAFYGTILDDDLGFVWHVYRRAL